MPEQQRLQLFDLNVNTGYVDCNNLSYDEYSQGCFQLLPMPEQFPCIIYVPSREIQLPGIFACWCRTSSTFIFSIFLVNA